ncbi:MAG: hypothetical protein M3063_03335 [Actinomycetota bacterium]|nr:hypothetical protein [Actinomycetota bacterium]
MTILAGGACPERPHLDDEPTAIAEDAVVTLTLLRSPMWLGDGLADLHATVSLLAQLRARIPISVSDARSQGHHWAAIAAQLEVTPAAPRRRHRYGETDRHGIAGNPTVDHGPGHQPRWF